MERKDIVLKNLAEEIKFNRHELLRLNKLDLQNNDNQHIVECLRLDFDKIKSLSENLMEILHQEDPNKEITKTPYGTILLIANTTPSVILNIIAKAFKAGNKVILKSEFNNSHTYKFLNTSWQSVLASQGHKSDHISFVDSSLDELIVSIQRKEISVDLLLTINTDEIDMVLSKELNCPIHQMSIDTPDLNFNYFIKEH